MRNTFKGIKAPFLTSALAFLRILIDQTQKTVRRPSRVLHFLLLATRNFAAKIYSKILSKEPAYLETIKTVQAEEYRLKGEMHLQNDQPQAAWDALARCLKISSDPIHFFVGALCLIVGLGRYKEGVSVFAEGNALRRKKAAALELTASRIRFLDHTWTGSFGHIAELDYPIKLGILEGCDRDDMILYIRPGATVVNRFLLEQWRPHLKIVEQEADLPLPLESMQALCFDFRGPLLANGTTEHYWKAAADVYRRWRAENRKPILTFPADVDRRGRLALESVGVPTDAWFVTLHVREAVSKNLHTSLHNVLNASIADYVPAINEIIKNGGWVIRVGDSAMTPLQPMPNVIDYCHSAVKCDWMDVYLLARARFFIGTSSGPAYVPQDYDVPCVLTNWWPPAQRPWHPQDIFIPKLCRNIKTGSLLPLSHSLAEPFGYCNSMKYLQDKFGVVVENNSAEDIHAATCEMLKRLSVTIRYSDEDKDLKRRADEIYRLNGGHGMASVSRDFLRRYSSTFLK